MVNRLKGEAAFTVGGETFTIVFDAAALLAIEDALDIGLVELFEVLRQAETNPRSLKIGTLATILACALQHNHPGMSRIDGCDLLISSFEPVFEALCEALNRAMPSAKNQEGAGSAMRNPPRAARTNGTGKRSSRAGAKPDAKSTSSGARRRG